MYIEALLGIATLLLALWLYSSPFYWRKRGVPCSLPVPFFGHALSFFTGSQRDQALKNYERWRGYPYWGYHMFLEPSIGLRNPSLIAKVLSSDSFLSLGLYTDNNRDPIGPSLLFTSGEAWRQARSKLSSTFSPAKVKSLLPVVDESLRTAELSLKAASITGKAVAASEMALSFATDAVTRNAFGIESDAFKTDSFLVALQRQMLKTATLFKSLLGLVSPRIYDAFELTMLGSKTNLQLGKVIGDVVDRRMRGEGVRTDFMQYMVDLLGKQHIDTAPGTNSDGTNITRIDVRWVVAQGFTLYMAGTEAVANSLTFALYQLALNPEVQERARKEAISVSADSTDIYGTVFTLPYIGMIINEVLRMYPLLSSLTRRCTKDFQLDEGVVVKKGTLVTIPVIGLHLDPEFFPDPDRFHPERHAPGSSFPAGSFLPFGYGQRICIGMRFGQSAIALALVRLLSKFRFSPCNKTEVPLELYQFSVTTTPKNPVFLRVEEL